MEDTAKRARVTEQWANMMLTQATEEMQQQNIDISPESLSHYFEKEYELPFSSEEAKAWLEKQEWYIER